MMRAPTHARGMTLVELIVAIIVVGMCVTTALSLVSLSVRSATAMTRTQASAIAASYLDEILSKRYVEDGVEASRQQYDDVRDYAGLDEMGARNANGTLITGLSAYRVQVGVFDDLMPNGVNARRIEVTVTDPNSVTVMLMGYRTNYAGQVFY